MQGKRKYFLILLFLLLGLGVYTFANPGDEEQARNENENTLNRQEVLNEDEDEAQNLETPTANVYQNLDREEETIDATAPIITVEKDYQDGKVIITLISDAPLRPIEGWEQVDERTYTREYNTSGEYDISVIGLNGNGSAITFNIDLDAPKGEIKYNTKELTNGGVIATLKVNEPIDTTKLPGAWNEYNNGLEFRKVFFANVIQNVSLVDLNGNESTVTVEIDWIDNVKPETPIITNSSGGNWSNTNVLIEWYANDGDNNNSHISGISHYEYSFDNEIWYRTEETSMEFAENQETDFYIFAVDNANNKSEFGTTQIKIDDELIKVTKVLNNGKTNPVKDSFQGGRPRVTVSSKLTLKENDGFRYTWTQSETQPTDEEFNIKANCSVVNETSFVSYTQNITDFITEPNGIYYLWYRIEDIAGNVIYYRTNSYLFDNVAPETPTVNDGDYIAGTWVNYPVTLYFSSEDNLTDSENLRYESTTSPVLHPDSWKPISNPITYDKDIHNNVYVRAIDEAGNISEYSKFFNVKVDMTAPNVPVIETNEYDAGAHSNKDVTLTATGSGWRHPYEAPVSYQYKLKDDETIYDGASVTFEESIDTEVIFRAIDEAGNASDWTDSVHVIVDKDAPETPTITAKDDYIAGTWVNYPVTLYFSSEDNLTDSENLRYESTTAPGYINSWKPISNPITYDKDIHNNVYVRAIDKAGNISEYSKFFNVKVDMTAPNVPVIDTNEYDAGTHSNKDVTLTATGSEWKHPYEAPVSYQYKLKDDETIYDGASVTFKESIATEVIFRAIDEAGNISDWTDSIRIIIDKDAPNAEIDYGNVNWQGNVLVTLEATETINNLDGWSTNDNITFTKLYTSNVDEEIVLVDIAGNETNKKIEISNINPLLDGIDYSTDKPTKMVKTTLFFNQPVILENDLWIPDITFTKWSRLFLDNIDKEIKFRNFYGKENTGQILITNIDHILNEVKETKVVADDEKSVTVTITADEEIIVTSNGWSKTDDTGMVWQKIYTSNTLPIIGDLLTYRDIAGNYKRTRIHVSEIRRGFFNTTEEVDVIE